jgi:hypothetical protein
MVDEIKYFVHHCHGKEFCTTYLGGVAPGEALQYPFRVSLHYQTAKHYGNTHFQGVSPWPKECYWLSTWV